jgi:hypothetical protein
MRIKDIKFQKADNESMFNTKIEEIQDGMKAISVVNDNFEKVLEEYIKENYISKDTIKEKIEELAKEYNKYAKKRTNEDRIFTMEKLLYQINILKELEVLEKVKELKNYINSLPTTQHLLDSFIPKDVKCKILDLLL